MPGRESSKETTGTQSGTTSNNAVGTSTGTSNTTQNATQQQTGGTVNSGTTQINPWAPQQGALTDAFAEAQRIYGDTSKIAAPTDFTAQMTPDQLSTFQRMVSRGGNMAIPDGQAATAGSMATSGLDGLRGALTGFQDFNPNAANNPDSLVAAANKYVSGQNIDGQVNDAMLNARQTARDVTLPGIDQRAAISGNTNSTRTGIAEGMVERGLAQQSANLGATLRNDAYGRGLSLAEKQASGNNALDVGALTARGSLGTGAVNSGNVGLNSSVANEGALNATSLAGGAGEQAGEQARLTNLLQRYQSSVTSPNDALKELMGIIGSQNWGQSSTTTGSTLSNEMGTNTGTSNIATSGNTSTQENGTMTGLKSEMEKKTPSIWDTVSGLMSSAGSLFGGGKK